MKDKNDRNTRINLPYIQGLWALPWILIGFIVTVLLSRFFGEEKINKLMKKIALVLLYVFVPLLLFRIFLSVDFGITEIIFSIVCCVIFVLMYVLAYFFAISKAKKLGLKDEEKRQFAKTILTNQGRSSAFVGGAMLAIPEWRVMTAIYMSIGAIFLFAVIPFILSYLHKEGIKKSDKSIKINALPWYLKIFSLYLSIFAILAIIIHGITGLTHKSFDDIGTVFEFFTSLTIPAALYYVGAGIHPHDLKLHELKKLFGIKQKVEKMDHWPWVSNIFFLTVVIIPVLTVIFVGLTFVFNLIPKEWFAVLVINSTLPITSTNMFLVPYGIDKKVTALSVTWTTIVCVPIVVFLISFFKTVLP